MERYRQSSRCLDVGPGVGIRRRYSWRWLLPGAGLLVAVAAILPPLINIGRYQHRIAAGISESIGHPVRMASASFRLLPLPALTFSGFSVEEKPEFGNEPILRAESVVAYPRLISLWRGRLEIARIHFDNASLNLVRADDGSWNFASILVQAAHSPEAPTGQRHAGGASRFPYIEATNSRINFKTGNEKIPISFLNADLSVWLDRPDQWGLHFRAQPVRTDLDLDLADTGVLRIDGTLRRAPTLADVPVDLTAEWTAAPLGQLSRLTIGKDAGWRGDVDLQAKIGGTAGFAQVRALMKIAELHRAEFVPPQMLNLNARCSAHYRNASTSLENLACISTIGDGDLSLNGYLRNLETNPEVGLALKIEHVPSAAVLSGLQELRDGLGAGLRAVGTLNGQFRYLSSAGQPPQFSGEMGTGSLTLISPDSSRRFVLSPVRVLPEDRSVAAAGNGAGRLPLPGLILEPIRLSLGAPTPITLDGRFTPDGFDLHLNGSGAIARLRGMSKFVARPGVSTDQAVTLEPTGAATLDLDIRGPWVLPPPDPDHPATAYVTVGSIALKNAEVAAPYLSQPLKILSAQGVLSPGEIAWTQASIGYGPLEAQGTLAYPTVCIPAGPCAGHFQLTAPSLDVAELQSTLLGSSERGELLRAILDRITRRAADWPQLEGTVEFGALSLGKLVLHDAGGDLEISGKSLKIHSLTGGLLNGTARLDGTVDAGGNQPQYELDARVTDASPNALASLLGQHWGGGVASVSAQLRMSGFESQDLTGSATGTVHWSWRNGALAAGGSSPGLLEAPLRFDDWRGDALIENRALKIAHSILVRGSESIPVAGTISFDRKLDLNGGSGGQAFSISGDLAHPRVKAAAPSRVRSESF